jgi:hypothetical protein
VKKSNYFYNEMCIFRGLVKSVNRLVVNVIIIVDFNRLKSVLIIVVSILVKRVLFLIHFKLSVFVFVID